MHVLIAEKQLPVANAIDQALRTAGFTTTLVSTGDLALSEIKNHPPDLALLEVLMPKLLGTEVCLTIKQSQNLSQIPVILMSAGLKELEGISIAQTEYRADDYLLKPFNAEFLLDKIQQTLARRQPTSRPSTRQHDVDEIMTMPDEDNDNPYQRYNPRVPLNIEVNCESADVFFASPMMNISKGGIFLRTNDPLPIGKVIKLQFKLPDQAKTIDGSGRVVWVERPGADRPAGMGLRFKDFADQDLKVIYAYVRRLKQLIR